MWVAVAFGVGSVAFMLGFWVGADRTTKRLTRRFRGDMPAGVKPVGPHPDPPAKRRRLVEGKMHRGGVGVPPTIPRPSGAPPAQRRP